MTAPLNILSLIDIPWNSGLAAYAFDQALALREAGHKPSFACHRDSAAAGFAAREGFPLFPLSDRKTILTPLEILRLRRLVNTRGFDVLAPQTGRTQTLAWLASFLPGRPFAIIRTKSDASLPAGGLTFSRVKRVIAASEYIRKSYLKKGFTPAGVITVRQGIKPPSLPPLRQPPPFKIGLLGRLDPVKGHECFLKAAAELLSGGASAEFHIAGEEVNVKYADLRKAAAGLGIEEKVFFHGRAKDSFEFMSACDIGAVPSLGSEAVSRAALEWLACGKPLVASAVGSLPEFAGEQWLARPGDHRGLAEKLSELIADPQKARALGEENRTRAERDFSQKAFTSATCAVFEEAAGKP